MSAQGSRRDHQPSWRALSRRRGIRHVAGDDRSSCCPGQWPAVVFWVPALAPVLLMGPDTLCPALGARTMPARPQRRTLAAWLAELHPTRQASTGPALLPSSLLVLSVEPRARSLATNCWAVVCPSSTEHQWRPPGPVTPSLVPSPRQSALWPRQVTSEFPHAPSIKARVILSPHMLVQARRSSLSATEHTLDAASSLPTSTRPTKPTARLAISHCCFMTTFPLQSDPELAGIKSPLTSSTAASPPDLTRPPPTPPRPSSFYPTSPARSHRRLAGIPPAVTAGRPRTWLRRFRSF